MTDAPTLLPCPFCRGEAKQGVHDLHEPGIPMAYYVHCMGCFARSGCFDTITEAIAAWNRRAAPPAAADLTIEERIAAAMANQACTDDLAMVNRSSMDCPVGCPIHSPAAADEVERVRQAIYNAAHDPEGDGLDDWPAMALAAVAAMRKPANAATAAPLIVLNEDGSLDDYCGATGFRMEDMGGHFWALDCGRYRFHIEAVKRGQVRVTLLDDGAAHQSKETR